MTSQPSISLDDTQLAQRIKNRDAIAMGQMYERYGGLVRSLVLKRIPDPGMAEDLVQEIFLLIWRRIHTFDDQRGRLGAWIVTVARHRAIDHLRSERGNIVEYMAHLDDLDELDQPYRLPRLETRETKREDLFRRIETREALETLGNGQRKVLELAYFLGLTQAEIAARLRMPLGTVKTLARAALKTLRSSAQSQ